MPRPIHLLAVGLTTLDIAVHPVAALPPPDASQLVEKIALSPAGTAAGAALVAQTLGLRTALASAVGADPQGQVVRSLLLAAGVDTRFLATDSARPTSTTVLPIGPDGARPNWHMIGASLFAPIPDALFAVLPDVAAVHWGAVGFPGATPRAAEFLRSARLAGAYVACDLIAPAADANQQLDALLPYIDLFMPSLAEVQALAGSSDPVAAARQFMARGAGGCLVKMGAEGALLVLPDAMLHAPAHAIRACDTTSCGDSLCAGFLAARARGLDSAESLRFAVAVAAQVAMGVGTLGKLTGFADTQRFRRETPTRASAQ